MSKYHPSKRHGCDCPECRALCEKEPGWFMPEEIPTAAEFCGLTEDVFREQYLEAHELNGVPMWSPRRAALLTRRVSAVEGEAPSALPMEGATRAPQTTHCVFLKDGKCRIHSVKPFECRKVFGCEADRRHRRVREQMIRMVETFDRHK